MKWISIINISICVCLTVISNSSAQSFQWGSALPDEAGFSMTKLYAMRDTLIDHHTKSLLVIRNDKIILEWYEKGRHPGSKHYTASLAKSLVGGTSLLLALNDGRMQADDPAWKYIPEWRDHPLKSKITIRHLATHSSGIENSEITEKELAAAKAKGIEIKHMHMDLPGWKGDFWRQQPDPFSVSRDHAPVLFTPGTAYHYSNPGMAMLAYAVTASYKGSEYPGIRTILRERVMKPIGIKEREWSVGYNKTFETNGLKLTPNWGGANFTPRAAARIGRLMLRRGNWQGQQLIKASWVDELTKHAGMPIPYRNEIQPTPASSLGWYNNADGVWPKAPRDTYLGQGAQNQVLIVMPSLNLIVVRNGQDLHDKSKGHGSYYGIEKYLVNMLMDALIEPVPPYPMSEAIPEIEFAPASTIVRKARGSDTWPMTWADDDHLYTAYGDGHGFKPKVEKKLSLGLARISGGPGNFEGVNIRSETGEHIGQGRQGKKASGMLMVDGVLYMWLRNANEAGEHSQLGWSDDYGKTWRYAKWKFTETFGYPTFLNFGKNYQGARDEYVYVYSHDNKDPYKWADHMVLTRVPKNKITKRNAYEFFGGIDADGQPMWTNDIEAREPVFTHEGSCWRSGITYNAGLRRYLWSQTLPTNHDSERDMQFRGKGKEDVRYQGGFGIYEAPEPWGPWRTVYYTEEWDVGPGETSSFPSKWMSEDGKTCYLVFSGDDCFSVRKVVFKPVGE